MKLYNIIGTLFQLLQTDFDKKWTSIKECVINTAIKHSKKRESSEEENLP